MPKKLGVPAPEALWAITEAGLAQYEATVGDIRAKIAMGAYSDEDTEASTSSPLLRVEGSTGIVSIKGPLVNSDSFWNQIFGLVSYNSIRTALLEAVSDPQVDRIMLDIDSPGGAVNGVNDTAELISAIDQRVKPVFAYTDGTMASGAYWLGCSAREVHASQTAVIGSVGVIMTHMERSVQLEQNGIKATVIRAGKYKQLGNPNEPLTELGEAELQGMVDSVYKIFATHVSEERGKSYDYTDKHMAQGRVFLAENAKEIGLIDKISNFDTALAVVNAKVVDKNRFSFENNGIGANMSNNNKKTLVAAVEAALIAGGQLPAVEAVTTLGVEVDEAQVAALAAAAATTTPENPAIADTSATQEGDNSKDKLENSAVELLSAQVKNANDALVEAKVENKQLQTRLDQLEASAEGLKGVAVKSINAMQVALGQAVTSFEALDATAVLAAHQSLSADFTKNFKVGGVAAVVTEPDAPAKPALSNARRKAMLAAT